MIFVKIIKKSRFFFDRIIFRLCVTLHLYLEKNNEKNENVFSN